MISYKKFSGYEASRYRANFLRLSNMNMLPEIILTSAWSPIVWKNDYSLTDNFEFSDFLALDFDEVGEQSLSQINDSLQDHKRIIATTRSHQKEKNGVICDRFRLIIPWSRRITCYKTYRYNYKKVLEKYPWADKACFDGARFFFPSKDIVHIDRDSDYTWDVVNPIEALEPLVEKIESLVDGKIPQWCLNFINNGAVYCGSRNIKLFAVARELFKQGFSHGDVRRLILKSPIDWQGIELEAILNSAKKKEGK